MKFEKFVLESNRLLQSFDKKVVKVIEDPLILAYIGDAWFSVYVRNRLVEQGNFKVRVLQNLESKIVSAPCQALAWYGLESVWTEEEKGWFRRGRNASPTRTRAGADYRTSTGYEAILGFLLQANQKERLTEIAEHSFQVIIEHLKNKGGSSCDKGSTN